MYEETPDDAQTITGITKLNNFEFSSMGSISCWRAYSVGQGEVIKIEKSSSGELVVPEWTQAFCSVGRFLLITCKEKFYLHVSQETFHKRLNVYKMLLKQT